MSEWWHDCYVGIILFLNGLFLGFFVGYLIFYNNGFTDLCTQRHGVVIRSNESDKLLCVDPKVIEVTK